MAASLDPQLAALVVHDLKNALGGLEARLHRLAEQHPGPDSHTALTDCQSLRHRFVHFLTLYGQDRCLQAHASDECPRELLEALARDTSAAHPGLRIEVHEAGTSPPFWYYDPRLVRMALDAALHNATRFARQSIALSARTESGHLVLQVDDDGPGPSATLDEAHRDRRGTGLGTALCEAVARAHRLGERSGQCQLGHGPGGGGRLTLWLP